MIELDVLKSEVLSCSMCFDLTESRDKIVFGEGNLNTRLLMVGEAPGLEESKTARPFVGKSGKLLDSMIVACGWKREDVYILNTIRCRPPKNRVPTPQEIHNCSGFLERHIEIINPDFILCLGSVASNTIVGLPVGQARGNWYNYKGRKVLTTYHPSYLLRNPSAKALVWEDLKLLIEALGDGKVVRNKIAI